MPDDINHAVEVDGYVAVRSLVDREHLNRLLELANALVDDTPPGVSLRFEDNFPTTLPPRERISKLLTVHRHPEVLVELYALPIDRFLTALVGADVDLFLSQFVWKLPGAYGQPWHQDAPIFPFEPAAPVLGIWIALTASNASSSHLQIMPMSHRQGIREHGRNQAHKTAGRYVALTEDLPGQVLDIELEPGDALVFDSGLAHSSTDNEGSTERISLVLHFASARTVDRSSEVFGTSFNAWTPFVRRGAKVGCPAVT